MANVETTVDNKETLKGYSPSIEDAITIHRVYTSFLDMWTLRGTPQKYFNNRTLLQFINDSELRANGYVPTRAEQGKEEWQSNVFHPVTRNKRNAILASVALDIPVIRLAAQNEKQRKDATRAELMRNLVKFSYSTDNKEEQVFFEALECTTKGTVIVYDGYLKSKAKRKVITSFDPSTGKIEMEEQEVEVDNQCVNFILPLENVFIRDYQIFDIQKQPDITWVEYMDHGSFMHEFGKYANAKEVKLLPTLTNESDISTFFKPLWEKRLVNKNQVEVVRYFNKVTDEFTILANGVMLHTSPILLGKKKKLYPFAKTVFEPFAQNFFYGNSQPNSLMGEQDVINTLYNMGLDKSHKSMLPYFLIGNINKDDFDLEDQAMSADNKIYVQDIDKVRELKMEGISDADIKMIDMISHGLDLSSVDQSQQGIAQANVTARATVIANENARKLKGILYLFLTSLWKQKMNLRITNILTYYTKPIVKKVLDEENGKENIIDEYQSFLVGGVETSSTPITGQKGTMGIQMFGSKEDLPSPDELHVQEIAYQKQSGENVELVAITSDYLDDWIFDIVVESESLYQKESGLTQVKMEEKLRVLATYFPQLKQLNDEKLGRDTLIAYDDDPDEYELSTTPPQAPPQGATEGNSGAEGATPGQRGMKVPEANAPMPPL